MSVIAALGVAGALAGCGNNTYFAGRALPPSGLLNRVLIAVQNPNPLAKGALNIVDAYYDIRYSYNYKIPAFGIGNYSANLPATIQNLPEEQLGAVYATGDGSFTTINYAKETSAGAMGGLNGLSSSAILTRSGFVFAASQSLHVLSIGGAGGGYGLSLPGIYRVSANPGGSMALAFVQNSNYAYYPVRLTTQQTVAYAGGAASWPKAAVDCAPQNAPVWCLFQAQSPDNLDATGTFYGAPLTFDRPVKAVFSADGSMAYVLNCGPECGGTAASISALPVAPMIFLAGQASGLLPCNMAPCSNTNATPMAVLPIPGGASNALVDSSTMYVVGQCNAAAALASGQPQCASIGPQASSGLFTGMLTVVNLPTSGSALTASAPISISDGAPGAMSRILEADNNTLWIGMTKCTNGTRASAGLPYGCLTMVNLSTNSSNIITANVNMLESYLGDLTGIAAVTGLHKIYVAQGGQVYIYSTVDGTEKNNQFVTVAGTAADVAYMDGLTDANNTVY